MPRRYIQRPAILVDSKMRRIRIYKCVLRSLGYPSHILLVINPFGHSIKIMRSEKSDPRAFHLVRTPYDNNRSPEIFSMSLIRTVYALNECWDKGQSYRIYGDASPDGSEITFNLTNYTRFLGERGWQD